MKKLIAVFLILTLLPVGAFASVLPSALTQPLFNYTGDYDIKISLDNSNDVAQLLKEMEFFDETNINLQSFLKTLLCFDGNIKLQADIDEDFEDIKLSLVTSSSHTIDVNPNLNLSAQLKSGMWVDMNLADSESFSFDMIYTNPTLNKYVVLSQEDIPEQDGFTPENFRQVRSVLNKYYIENMNRQSAELLMKYAKYKANGTKHTISLDNEGFTAFFDELMSLSGESTFSIIEGEEAFSYAENIPKLGGCKLLGDNGIKIVYTVIGGKISALEINADVSIDILSFYKDKENWKYSSPGLIDFTLDIKSDISKINSTKVKFPELTDGNSIFYRELYPYLYYEDYYDEYEEEPLYPAFHTSGESTVLPISGDEMYFPFRQLLENAYGDSVHIEYADGVIVAECEYFPGFTRLKFDTASDKFYTDNTEYIISPSVVCDGVSYVNLRLFTDIFGWSLDYVYFDLIENLYYCGFSTEIFW